MRFAAPAIIVALVLLAGCADHAPPSASPSRDRRSIVSETSVRAHLEFLASDALNGRQSGIRDEQIAADYVGAQFRRLGLAQPEATNGSFVPLARRGQPKRTLSAPEAVRRPGSVDPSRTNWQAPAIRAAARPAGR